MTPEDAWQAVNQEMLDVLGSGELSMDDIKAIPAYALAIAHKDLERQLAECQQDARRYQWLKHNVAWSSSLVTRTYYWRTKNYAPFEEAIDDAIDLQPVPEPE